MFRINLIILFQFIFFTSQAFQITGTCKGFEGQFIRLYAISDFISYREVKLDVVQIDESGNFTLNGFLNNHGLIRIKIGSASAELLVKTGYKLKAELSFDEESNKGRIYDRYMNIAVSGDEGINKLVFAYQKEKAAFMEENQSKLITKQILPKVRTFRNDMQKKYQSSPDFFRTFLNYDLAALEDGVLGSETELFKNYISEKPLRYGNMAYMNFFSQFYQQRFIGISQGKDGFRLLSAVNGSQNYSNLFEIVRRHEFSGNDTICQLFIILGLKEVYGDETFKRDKVLSMLAEVRDKSLNAENKRICQNLIKELTFMKKGMVAPEFSLQDRNGEIRHLTDFRGKTMLLFFWSVNSTTSLRDFTWINDYQQKYDGLLQILAINIDDDPLKAVKYIESKQISALVLFKDRQYDLADKYRIYAAPEYVLINGSGNIDTYRARRPEENLEAEIIRLTSEK